MSISEVGQPKRHVCFPSDQTADIAGGPVRADFVAKVEKSNDPKNLANAGSRTTSTP